MSKIVEEYYNGAVEVEWGRLERHVIEYEMTKRHIDQFLQPQSTILDVGGGPGRYSFHYAQRGHRVTLFDLSPENIRFAEAKQGELGIALDGLMVGNALSMHELPDQSFDFVLCMGPLYHLVEEHHRVEVLRECHRVTKDGGVVFFSFVTHMAQTLSVIKRNLDNLARWEPSLVKGIETNLNDTDFDTGFTEAFFIKPWDIRTFVEAQGFSVLKIAGAEGIACQNEAALMRLEPRERARWIDFSFRYSEDPSTLGANQHVICVARKR